MRWSELDYVGCITNVVGFGRCWFKKNPLIDTLLGELKLSDNRDTNMTEQTVEQITSEPAVKDRVKDPEKVEAKEALKEKEQRDAWIDNQKEKEQQQQQQDALVEEDDELKLSDNRDTNMAEQITREPDVKDRVKDPKKVEAGKKLAEYHKKAKEALKEKEQRDALIDSQKEKEQQQQEQQHDALVKEDDEGSSMDVNAWIPSLSFGNVLIIGSIIGITAYSLYTGYKDKIADLHVPSVTFGPPPVRDMNEVRRPSNRENSLNDELM